MDKYYEVLGLGPGASQKEIKEAYRDLAKVWHPDRFSSDPRLQEKAQEKLKEIIDAYENLTNHHYSARIPTEHEPTQNENGEPTTACQDDDEGFSTFSPKSNDKVPIIPKIVAGVSAMFLLLVIWFVFFSRQSQNNIVSPVGGTNPTNQTVANTDANIAKTNSMSNAANAMANAANTMANAANAAVNAAQMAATQVANQMIALPQEAPSTNLHLPCDGQISNSSGNVVLRSTPGMSIENHVTELSDGDSIRLTRLSSNKRWVRVRTDDGETGWISAKFVKCD